MELRLEIVESHHVYVNADSKATISRERAPVCVPGEQEAVENIGSVELVNEVTSRKRSIYQTIILLHTTNLYLVR